MAEGVDNSLTDIQDEVARLRAEIAALEQDKERKEKQEQVDVFRAFDTDGNGKVDADELRSGVKDLWGVEVDTTTASSVITKLGSSEGSVLQSTEFDLRQMEEVLNQVVAESQAAKAKKATDLQKKQNDASQKTTAKALEDLGVGEEDLSQKAAELARVGSVFAYVLPILDMFRFSQALLHFSWAAPLLSIMDFGNQILYGSPFGLGSLIIFIAMQRISSDATQPFLLRFNMWQAALMSMFYFVPGCLRIFATIGSQAALGSYDKWGDWSPGRMPESLSDAGNTLVFILFGGCILYSVVSSMMGVRPRIPWLSQQVEKTLPSGR